jgi:hypothetical protein
MDNNLNRAAIHGAEMRKGNTVNMDELLEEFDSLYLAELDGSITCYDTYDKVSDETYNDYKIVCVKLEMLNKLGYLTENEKDEMMKTAAEMRLEKLEGLEHEESGS